MASDGFFIGELAERTDLTRDAIRYYERARVLPEPRRTDSGYRVYGRDDVERLAFVGQAQALGLTLEEIADVLSLVDRGVEPCEHVEARLEDHLQEVRERMDELRRLEVRLEAALDLARSRPSAGGCRCGIIEGIREENAPEGGER